MFCTQTTSERLASVPAAGPRECRHRPHDKRLQEPQWRPHYGAAERRAGEPPAGNLQRPGGRANTASIGKPLMSTLLLAATTLLLLLYFKTTASEGVDCFKCSSRNGSNPACEDPFHNTNTTRVTQPILPDPQPAVIYHTPCYAGRKNREGLFPASACIKLTGTFDTTGETLVVRHCALDSGSLTQDTELARMSHCGKFQFEGDLLREDACNSAPSARARHQRASLTALLPLVAAALLMSLAQGARRQVARRPSAQIS